MAAQNSPQNYPNAGHFYSNLAKPIEIDLNFVVDATNGNGLGVRSVKSNGYVQAVFMHTSATPGSSNGLLNPNPAVGYAEIILRGNFNSYVGGFSGVVPALAGSPSNSVTGGNPYVITSIGTTTPAQWQAAGLQAGVTPTVGQAFIATITGAIGGTGTTELSTASTVLAMQVIGDTNQSIANTNTSQNGGARLIVQFVGAAGVVTPANGTVVGMTIKMDGSSVSVDGL